MSTRRHFNPHAAQSLFSRGTLACVLRLAGLAAFTVPLAACSSADALDASAGAVDGDLAAIAQPLAAQAPSPDLCPPGMSVGPVTSFPGSPGDDVVRGTNGGDSLSGGPCNDRIRGRAGDDVLNGGRGDDLISAGPGKDVVDGGPGFDICIGDENDTFMNCEVIIVNGVVVLGSTSDCPDAPQPSLPADAD